MEVLVWSTKASQLERQLAAVSGDLAAARVELQKLEVRCRSRINGQYWYPSRTVWCADNEGRWLAVLVASAPELTEARVGCQCQCCTAALCYVVTVQVHASYRKDSDVFVWLSLFYCHWNRDRVLRFPLLRLALDREHSGGAKGKSGGHFA
jgi:hypothetical protein